MSWVGIMFTRIYSAAFLLFIFSFASASQASGRTDVTWVDLFERCKGAIEEVKSFDTDNLEYIGSFVESVPPVVHPALRDPIYPGYDIDLRRWADPASVFFIEESLYPSGAGLRRRVCSVKVMGKGESFIIRRYDEIVNKFKNILKSLVSEGAYRISPYVDLFQENIGVVSYSRNARGCYVSIFLQMETRRDNNFLFRISVGEMSGCVGGRKLK